jgi:hypothetical protein
MTFSNSSFFYFVLSGFLELDENGLGSAILGSAEGIVGQNCTPLFCSIVLNVSGRVLSRLMVPNGDIPSKKDKRRLEGT